MTFLLFFLSGFFTGMGFLFRYLNQYANWLNWVGLGAWIVAGLFVIWAIVSVFQWLAERRRRKAQLWHRRYVDLAAAQNTRKIILELPQAPKEPQTPKLLPYVSYQYTPPLAVKKNKGNRRNGKR